MAEVEGRSGSVAPDLSARQQQHLRLLGQSTHGPPPVSVLGGLGWAPNMLVKQAPMVLIGSSWDYSLRTLCWKNVMFEEGSE